MSRQNVTRTFAVGKSPHFGGFPAEEFLSAPRDLRPELLRRWVLGRSPSTALDACEPSTSCQVPEPSPAALANPLPNQPLDGRVAAPLRLSFVELVSRPRREHIVALKAGGVLCGARGEFIAVIAGSRRVCRACARRAGAYVVAHARGGRP